MQFIGIILTEWLKFLSNVINSLAWPVCILVIVLLLKKEFPLIIRALRKLKYKDFELEFGESVRKVEKLTKEEIPEIEDDINIAGDSIEKVKNRLYTIADISPRSAILEAWLIVETAATHLISVLNIAQLKSMPGPMRLRDHLIKGQVLNRKQVNAFEELRVLRNEAAHVADTEFTVNIARNYIGSALTMAAYLEQKSKEI